MRLTPTQYARALLAAYEEAKGKDRASVIQRFLARLRRERRSRWLGAVVRVLERMRDEGQVSVRSARALKPATRSTIEAMIGWPITHSKIEPNLLGGVIIEMGDRRLDASLAGKITALRKKLCPT